MVPSVSTETKITVCFVGLGLTGWYLVQQMTTNTVVEFAVLIGLGVVVPTLVNEWRRG
jgi:hypothetical protein